MHIYLFFLLLCPLGALAQEIPTPVDGSWQHRYSYEDMGLKGSPKSMKEEGNMQGKKTTYYEWDSSGRIQTVRYDKSSEYRYQYDENGNLKQADYWRSGKWQSRERYVSTPDGKLLRHDTEEKGKLWTRLYEYDANGLLIKDSTSNRSVVSYYFYNEAKVLTKYVTYEDGVFQDSMRYFYDDKGRWVRSLRAQFGEELVASYNEQGRMIYCANQTVDMWTKYSYDADGCLIKSWSGYSDVTEEETSYTYDIQGSRIHTNSKSLREGYNNGEAIWERRTIEYW